MSGILDQTAEGITTNTNGQTCIKPTAWDTIIKATIALMIAEFIVVIFFIYVRYKRHHADHMHGHASAYAGWLKRKLDQRGLKKKRKAAKKKDQYKYQ
ncbi:uncharacterized protein L203_102853 [Cryptococcus depauperatus CBS 7841]|uniref:Uncharacterized protein n=1 Tax=Cryptococcus depauperatus CBS 7841 TaxID=1295531 RepID=A0AAJ8JSI1_9TREE